MVIAAGLWSWILLANAVSFEGSPGVVRAQAVRVLRATGPIVEAAEAEGRPVFFRVVGSWW
ncbi:MAG: hypothetical protein AB1806_08020 [Acidobacteriota bacterium]